MMTTNYPLRPELEALPDRMHHLAIDERGYPIPWFVEYVDGKPEFRVMDHRKWVRAVKEKLCWTCGTPLGVYKHFVLGPMCGITRTTSEPANHRACAQWAVRNCPFLARPHMTRRGEEELKAMGATSAGNMLTRNPGVALIWNTISFKVFRASNGYLISVGDPVDLEWYAEGRPATRTEVEHSIAGGIPSLMAEAQKERGGIEALEKAISQFRRYLPEE